MPKPDLPESITLGSRRIGVYLVDGLAKYENADGRYNYGRGGTPKSIEIDDRLTGDEHTSTVIHEIGHALVDIWGSTEAAPEHAKNDDVEHYYVEIFEKGLIDLLRSNPGLKKWLIAAVR